MIETVEQFLARGGKVTRCPASPRVTTFRPFALVKRGYVAEGPERNKAAHGPAEGPKE
jgi:hypothetical protein